MKQLIKYFDSNNITELIKVSSSTSLVCETSLASTTSDTSTWRGGWITDNWSTYYLDGNLVKHNKKPK